MCDNDGSDTDDSFSNDEEENVGETPPSIPSGSVVGGDHTPLISVSSDGKITPVESGSTTIGQPEEAKGDEKKKDGKAKEGGGGGGGKGVEEEEEGPEDKGDLEMAPIYLQRLLPIFTEIYHSSLAPALRKESLRLMRKMCHYISAKCLQELCQDATPSDPTQQSLFSARISEVLAAVMETEDDHEAHLSALHIMQDLLGKNRKAFDEQFVRLGLPNKIAALAGLLESDESANSNSNEEGAAAAVVAPPEGEDVEDGKTMEEEGEVEEGEGQEPSVAGSEGKVESEVKDASSSAEAKKPEEKLFLEDATEIVIGTPYQWHDWCVVRSRDCLYSWNEYCVIELSNVSNGWFRFLVDSRLATMYSSGSTEGGPDSYGEGVSEAYCVSRNAALCQVHSGPLYS